ncbi:MAG: thrombospondin type 3 repeat-containing protein [Byssovorax sp.]
MRERRAREAAVAAMILAFAAASILPASARAQTFGGIALDQLDPAPAGDTFTAVPSPFAAGHLVPRGIALFDYAARPLTLVTTSSSRPVVSGQGFLHLGASFALWDRLLLSLSLPVAIVQSGEAPSAGHFTFASPSSAQVGDLRIGARIRLVGDDGAPFQLGVSAAVHAPTAPAGSFAGERSARLSPRVVAGGQASRFVWSAAAGVDFHGDPNPSTFAWGAAAGVRLGGDRAQLGVEIFGATPVQASFFDLDPQTRIARGLGSNVEVELGVKVRLVRSLFLTAAAGPGLTDAIGTPTFRALGALAWAPLPESAAAPTDAVLADTDADGVVDRDDACPFAYGVASADRRRNGCPLLDADEDGIADEGDACPDRAGAKSADPKRNGCPIDSDGDGVPDGLDGCPKQKGSAATNGCPAPK